MAASAGATARQGSTSRPAGQERCDGTAFRTSQRETLIAHDAGGQRVDHGLRSPQAERFARRRTAVIAVVTARAVLVVDDGTLGRRLRLARRSRRRNRDDEDQNQGRFRGRMNA